MNKYIKYALVPFLLLLLSAYVVFSNNVDEGAKTVIYPNGAFVSTWLDMDQQNMLPIPYEAVSESISVMPVGSNLILMKIKKTGELEGNIGKQVKVFFGENQVNGTLIDLRGSRAYVKTDDGVYVVSPSAYVVEAVESVASLYLEFDSKPAEVLLSYATSTLNWRGSHSMYLDESKNTAILRTNAFVTNRGEQPFEGEVILVAGETNLPFSGGYGSYYDPAYSDEYYESAVLKTNGASLPQTSQGAGLIRYAVDKAVKLEPKESSVIPLDEVETDYARLNTYVASIYGNSKSKAIRTIKFSAPSSIAAGSFYVYDKNGEFIGYSSISDSAEDDEVRANIGKSFFVTGETTIEDVSYFLKTETRRISINVTNNGENSEKVEVLVPITYYGKLNILNSNYNYLAEQGQLKYEFDLNSKQSRIIEIDVEIIHPS